ncbi:hypothetical protein [Alloalcanivorax gelatiniphagus]|uniref:DUF1772 domain-containing protein n=1 Tax=Alloalcanivorax gelatiniphagus TaxID=1194167 RepID=A0ABY2XJ68_9GAMM|nr:hypothetical protein [Alloalcanivorax gelatiniphagus]TMW11951.1 hypothetical protein FGS76_13065 [Alloalcanivorax gelatiniphagus]
MSIASTPRSNFVTVVAWIFIVLSGFASLVSLLQNLMLHFAMPMDEMRQHMSGQAVEQMPAAAMFILGHIELIFAAFLVVCLGTLASSIGLLKRKNWARIAFVALMLLGVFWNLGGLVLQQIVMSQMPIAPDAAPDFQSNFEFMMTLMRVVAALFALGMSTLFGWIAWRLWSPSIVAEFGGVDLAEGRGEKSVAGD